MNKFLFFITIILFSYSTSNAEVIKNIIINGNKRISDETIKIYGDINLNKDYSEEDLNNIINDLYNTEFFEDIKINLSNNTLQIDLKEYPVISQLIVVGEPSKRYTFLLYTSPSPRD